MNNLKKKDFNLMTKKRKKKNKISEFNLTTEKIKLNFFNKDNISLQVHTNSQISTKKRR